MLVSVLATQLFDPKLADLSVPRARLEQSLSRIITKDAPESLKQVSGAIVVDYGDMTPSLESIRTNSGLSEYVKRLADQLKLYTEALKNQPAIFASLSRTRFHSWQYAEAALEAGGEVFTEVREHGEVEAHQGYRAHEDTRPASGKAERDEDETPAVRPELTKAAENYLALHRHAIGRAELLAHPAIALRLAAAHMIAGSPLWSIKPDPQRAEKEAVGESVAKSPAQAALDAEGVDRCWSCSSLRRAISVPSHAVMAMATPPQACLPGC
jgi:hypothetical protein